MKKKQGVRMLYHAGRYLEKQLPTTMMIGEQFALTAALCILANAYNEVLTGGTHVHRQ
jgi:hypothetical protein